MVSTDEKRSLLENRLRQIDQQLRILNPFNVAGGKDVSQVDYEDLEALYEEREIIQRKLNTA